MTKRAQEPREISDEELVTVRRSRCPTAAASHCAAGKNADARRSGLRGHARESKAHRPRPPEAPSQRPAAARPRQSPPDSSRRTVSRRPRGFVQALTRQRVGKRGSPAAAALSAPLIGALLASYRSDAYRHCVQPDPPAICWKRDTLRPLAVKPPEPLRIRIHRPIICCCWLRLCRRRTQHLGTL